MSKRPKSRLRNKKTGLPPGSVIFTGNKKVENVVLHFLQYNLEQFKTETYDSHDKIIFAPIEEGKIDWYDIRGLHDIDIIEQIGKAYDIHSLVLEDVVSTNQRPKFEEYTQGNFVIIRALSFDRESLEVETEQVAIYFRKGFIVSFQESGDDLFAGVRTRLKNSYGKIRQRGTDYLCYALIDNVVDHYYSVFDDIEDVIEDLEGRLLSNPGREVRGTLHSLKKELLTLRRSISPLREAISRFSKAENEFIDESSFLFIRDLYDHTVQVLDRVEVYRDMLNSLQELYLSEVSTRMNQVMQVLTLIATIFIPLTFLVGVYGMNFKNMPELQWKYGYFMLWGVMVVIFVILLLFFKRRKWL